MKPGYIVYIVIALLAMMFLYSQFFDDGRRASTGQQPIRDSLIVGTYPELYDAIYSRDAARLTRFLKHDSLGIRRQAWRAFASTPVDSINPYLRLALESELKESWFALSMHEFESEQLRDLEAYWIEKPAKRAGISRVLGRQGDRLTLEFMLDRTEQAADSFYEYDYTLALGRLMTKYRLDSDGQTRVIRQAFLSDNAAIIRACLYGFYRGEVQKITEDVENTLYQLWKEYGLGNSTIVDQYIVKILGGDVFYEVALYQNSEKVLDQHIQLAVELAQSVSGLELNQRNILAIRILLMHENPHVGQQTLASLQGKLTRGENLYNFITSEMVADSLSDPFVWLQALETASGVNPELISEHSDRLNSISENHPYLLPRVLQIWQLTDTPKAYLQRTESLIKEGSLLKSLFAVNALYEYWRELPDDEQTAELIDKTRAVVFKVLELNDRGVAYAGAGLLADEMVFKEDDFNRINQALSSFTLPGDIEVYQTFGKLYKQRFERQAKPVVDSLASLGYAPLNRSLKQVGWDVSVPEGSETEFRTPDWQRLWELGENPTWVLDTEKGVIKIRMKTLSAPATISAIDSLTLAGAYDGIPFHRVVPNFVIQGGDIERQDGFGGPDFIIPTEAGETGFDRGAAGIASAGTDTEGSQYFFMHQWKPHLNGRYTLFGNVIQGMDVVDRIVPGDKVVKAYWE